jgi:hypothetical protein
MNYITVSYNGVNQYAVLNAELYSLLIKLGSFVQNYILLLQIMLAYLLRGLSPQANYTNRATAACRRS